MLNYSIKNNRQSLHRRKYRVKIFRSFISNNEYIKQMEFCLSIHQISVIEKKRGEKEKKSDSILVMISWKTYHNSEESLHASDSFEDILRES